MILIIYLELTSSPKKAFLTPFGLVTLNSNYSSIHTCTVSARMVSSSSGGSDGNGNDIRNGSNNSDVKNGGGNRSSGSGSGSGGGKDGQLCCPKCGNPCTHVETFVCELNN